MQKTFYDVFKPANISSKIMTELKDASVENVCFYKSTKTLKIDLLCSSFIREDDSKKISDEIQSFFPGVEKIYMNLKYRGARLNLNDAVKNHWKDILFSLEDTNPICTTMLANSSQTIDGNTLKINLASSPLYLEKKGFEKRLKKIMMDKFNIDANIIFEQSDCKQDYNNLIESRKMLEDTLIQVSEPKPVVVEMKSESIITGKTINGEAIRIADASDEGELVIISGQVLSVEIRELKSREKCIVIFDLTDYTDSTTVKFFITTEKCNTIVKPSLKKGMFLKIRGEVQFDKYSKENCIMAKDVEIVNNTAAVLTDNCKEKRIELHLHTKMSSMDGINSVSSYFERAKLLGHEAIAITDHGVVQAYPEAMDASKKYGVKAIYGVEAYIVDDLGTVVKCPHGQSFDGTFVVFDIETTGLSKEKDSIIEIGAVKIENYQIVETFNSFINPRISLPDEIVKLTGIKDEMLKDAPSSDVVLAEFLDFVKDAPVVAHNASFDVGFIRASNDVEKFDNTVIDTLELSRVLFPKLNKHKLNIVCEHLDISLENHHRACDDAHATALLFLKCLDILKQNNATNVEHINSVAAKSVDYKKLKAYHAVILVQNQVGLKNLYELVSLSHLNYFFKRPRIPKSVYNRLKEGLIIGSACEAGELYKAMLEKMPDDYITELVNFYDYLEIQPLGNNQFLIEKQMVFGKDELISINKKIIKLGEKFNKPVIATGDVHFLDKSDAVFRKIIMTAEGFSDADNQAPLYYRTTEEMLNEFYYLSREKAFEVVVQNPKLINSMIENVLPIPKDTYPPKIEGAEEELRSIATSKAKEIYGEKLPPVVNDRLERELNSIIKNGFSVMYIIAQKLVWNSLEAGYLVGSRGSVGSSFVATMASITEVNPLPPHYICPNCKYSDFDSDVVLNYGGNSGCDMPDKYCPECSEPLRKDGHDIPFETFLGFDGDKEPDIDLNFSGEYQQHAHAYTEELFGSENVFKAGTIGTVAEKTGYGYVLKYLEKKGITKHNAEIKRLGAGCVGVKRTTGQHPGGLMILPKGHSIYEFCPVQRPANDMKSSIITTHFDYHSISGRLLKLDLLGHDDPTVIRMLHDLTGIDPRTVSLDDKETMSLFTSTKALKISPSSINCETGSLGLPEFGTKFVRQMLLDTQPTTFAELIRIAGLSHGTDVWLNNAQEIVRNGVADLKSVISTRDDIMVYLISKGMDKLESFKIMENVRKGKGLKPDEEQSMKDADVPQWYIESCKKISYMFPKAHAAAYVMMSFRIAYFKVHHPLAFYASYLSVRADDFDYATMCRGEAVLKRNMEELEDLGKAMKAKDQNKYTICEVVLEMYARGFNFLPLDIYKSDAKKFLIVDGSILPPLNSIQGLGTTAAEGIVAVRDDGEFVSLEDFRIRSGVSRTVVDLLKELGILDLSETAQLSLF